MSFSPSFFPSFSTLQTLPFRVTSALIRAGLRTTTYTAGKIESTTKPIFCRFTPHKQVSSIHPFTRLAEFSACVLISNKFVPAFAPLTGLSYVAYQTGRFFVPQDRNVIMNGLFVEILVRIKILLEKEHLLKIISSLFVIAIYHYASFLAGLTLAVGYGFFFGFSIQCDRGVRPDEPQNTGANIPKKW